MLFIVDMHLATQPVYRRTTQIGYVEHALLLMYMRFLPCLTDYPDWPAHWLTEPKYMLLINSSFVIILVGIVIFFVLFFF